jgi:hypothetical protein
MRFSRQEPKPRSFERTCTQRPTYMLGGENLFSNPARSHCC